MCRARCSRSARSRPRRRPDEPDPACCGGCRGGAGGHDRVGSAGAGGAGAGRSAGTAGGAGPGARRARADPAAAAQGWVATALERPLFRTDRRPPKGADEVARGGDEPLRLTGVITGPFGNRAIFRSGESAKPIVAEEKAQLNGFMVRSIEPGKAIIVETDGTAATSFRNRIVADACRSFRPVIVVTRICLRAARFSATERSSYVTAVAPATAASRLSLRFLSVSSRSMRAAWSSVSGSLSMEFLPSMCPHRTAEIFVEPSLALGQPLLPFMVAPQPVDLVAQTFERPGRKNIPLHKSDEHTLQNLPPLPMAPKVEGGTVRIGIRVQSLVGTDQYPVESDKNRSGARRSPVSGCSPPMQHPTDNRALLLARTQKAGWAETRPTCEPSLPCPPASDPPSLANWGDWSRSGHRVNSTTSSGELAGRGSRDHGAG